MRYIVLPILATLAACTGEFSSPLAPKQVPEPEPTEVTAPIPRGGVTIGGPGKTADSLDTTTQEERDEASQPKSDGASLGSTVASLGDPGQTGFWLKTPLVTTEGPGRVETASGQSVNVTLMPLSGAASAGSEISLAAMRQLGLGLTDLPTLSVFSG